MKSKDKEKMRKILFLLSLLFCSVASYAGRQTVHLYGFAASFNDSIVYFTDLQTIAQAAIDRNNFLYGREEYSNQLRDYLAAQGYPHATCVTVWATSRAALEKKYQRMRSRYLMLANRRAKKNGTASYTIKYLTPEEFSYTPVTIEKEVQTK